MVSVTDAAFSGFRTARENLRAMLIWMVTFGLFQAAMTALMMPTLGPVLVDIQAMQGQVNPDEQEVLALFNRLVQAVLPLIAPVLLVSAVQSAAVNRMILRPRDSGFGYLRIGADEFRQLAVMLLLVLVMAGVNLAGGLLLGLLGVAAGLVGPLLVVPVMFVGVVTLICAVVVVSVRLSLAKAQTFATGRINLFGSWGLTRGRFWPILGAYVLAAVMFLIVSTAVQAIAMLAIVAFGGGFAAVGAVQAPDFSSLQTFLTRGMIINLAVSLVASPFVTLILLCPAPEIYRSLAGTNSQA